MMHISSLPQNKYYDPDRLKRVHVVNVRFDSKSNMYYLTMAEGENDKDKFEISWNEWIRDAHEYNPNIKL